MLHVWRCCLLCLVFTVSAHSALRLELTQGISSALPIAVTAFSGEEGTDIDDRIATIIAQDLKNSGRFKILPLKTQSSDVDFWRDRGADNVVIGEVKSLDGNKKQVTIKLLDILSNQTVLFNKTFKASGKQLRQLAHHISDVIYYKLTGQKSTFNTRIAYILMKIENNKPVQYQLEISDADGFNPHTLLTSSQPIMSPSWSPDGKKLAFVSFEKKRSQVYVIDIASGKRDLITSYKGINGAPTWSPDGTKMALVLSKTGQPKVYSVDIGNKTMTQLTFGQSIDTEPDWSPDGKEIIFTSNRGGSPQIYAINLASREISRVTYTGVYNARASYTPDGKNIVMLHRDETGFNIAIQDRLHNQLQSLTYVGSAESPSVAPNGKMIIYASNREGMGVLYIVSTDGKVKLRLPAREGNVQEPAWAPYS